jgi:hypothetical protein
MGDVYANSEITIAASIAINSEQGLFFTRPAQKVWPCRIATGVPQEIDQNIVISPPLSRAADLKPLITRAWAFQEWLLSKRILHIGKDQIRWECFSLGASQVYPDGTNTGERDENLTKNDLAGLQMLAFRARKTKRKLHDETLTWWRMRERYARKELTYNTDRLTALAGIAQLVYRKLDLDPADYLVGLHRPVLLEELLRACAVTR